MSEFIVETMVTEGGASLRHEAKGGFEWWWFQDAFDEYERAIFDSAADLRRFLVASLAALDEWEARRG